MMNYFAENNRGDGMDQKELTQVTCVIHGGRSLPVYWKRGCVKPGIRIVIDLYVNFGYLVSKATVCLGA
jgi:hypothetical protein